MSKSLKSCLPALAGAFSEKPDTLYERQRALVREGLLESLPGHGRGSGVRATPESIATLIIGMLASTSLAEVGPLARSFSKTTSIESECPLTGAETFHAALSRILSDESLAKRVNEISVRVNEGRAAIGFDGGNIGQDTDFVILAASLKSRGAKGVKVSRDGRPLSVSVFSARKHQERGLLVSVSIRRETVRDLAAAVTALLADSEST
jgi:hypothetical protein